MPLSYKVLKQEVEDCFVRSRLAITFDDGVVREVETGFGADEIGTDAKVVYDAFVQGQANNYADEKAKVVAKADKESALQTVIDKVALNEKITL